MMPTKAMARAPVDSSGSQLVLTSGMCGLGRLRGTFAATDTAVWPPAPGIDQPARYAMSPVMISTASMSICGNP